MGIAKKGKIYTEFVGTPPYMSPERLGEYNCEQLKKSDIWAIGVIAYEMYSGKRCFEGDTQKQVFGKILRGEWSWKSERKPTDKMQDFIKQCLEMDTKKRLSADDALMHPWFADMNKKQECRQLDDIKSNEILIIEDDDNKLNLLQIDDCYESGKSDIECTSISDLTEYS